MRNSAKAKVSGLRSAVSLINSPQQQMLECSPMQSNHFELESGMQHAELGLRHLQAAVMGTEPPREIPAVCRPCFLRSPTSSLPVILSVVEAVLIFGLFRYLTIKPYIFHDSSYLPSSFMAARLVGKVFHVCRVYLVCAAGMGCPKHKMESLRHLS